MEVAPKEIQKRLDHFKTVARDAGLKLTHQRLEIFRAVASTAEHPSADIVHRAVVGTSPTVSLDTVYRTLWLLTDLGLLNTVGPRQGSVRFDANVDNHHHYVCTRCGLVRDFDSAALDALQLPDTVSDFGRVISAHVEVRGVCDTCATEPSAASPPPSTPQPARGASHE